MVESLAVGLLLGAAAGTVLSTANGGNTDRVVPDRKRVVLSVPLAGGMVGAVLGALFPAERWRRLAPDAARPVGTSSVGGR